MTTTPSSHAQATGVDPSAVRPGDLPVLMRSFDRSLRAINRSFKTREQYLMSDRVERSGVGPVAGFGAWVAG